MLLTIDVKNTDEIIFITELLHKLNVKVISSEKKTSKNQTKAIEALQKIAERGEMAKLIEDPVAWQKEIRKDRKLPFREED